MASDAKVCPHCGVEKPVKSRKLVYGVLAAIFVFWLIGKQSLSENQKKAESPEVIAACKADLTCWGNRNIVAADVYCKRPVEQLAKYNSKWTTATFEQKFSRFRWKDKEQGYLTYIGDKVEFQNGFGVYQPHVYECDIDPVSKQVFDVRVQPGRLP